MNTIQISWYTKVPEDFTGIATRENGTQVYYNNGKRHREDGPAIIHPNGEVEYWVHGRPCTAKEIETICQYSVQIFATL
jgi:hypothetical protein